MKSPEPELQITRLGFSPNRPHQQISNKHHPSKFQSHPEIHQIEHTNKFPPNHKLSISAMTSPEPVPHHPNCNKQSKNEETSARFRYQTNQNQNRMKFHFIANRDRPPMLSASNVARIVRRRCGRRKDMVWNRRITQVIPLDVLPRGPL